MTRPLTAFQETCLREVGRLLTKVGFHTEFELVEGREETYFVGRLTVGCDDIEIYVYDDEAGFFVNREWHIYETPDYSSPDQLMAAFLGELEETIQRSLLREGSRK